MYIDEVAARKIWGCPCRVISLSWDYTLWPAGEVVQKWRMSPIDSGHLKRLALCAKANLTIPRPSKSEKQTLAGVAMATASLPQPPRCKILATCLASRFIATKHSIYNPASHAAPLTQTNATASMHTRDARPLISFQCKWCEVNKPEIVTTILKIN